MRLDVWLEAVSEPIGILERKADKSLTFTYTGELKAEKRLSIALPVRKEDYSDAYCVAYFGNLLFEGRELDRIMALYRIDRDDIGKLLYHLGADCPGAVSITPEGTGPGKRPGVFPDDYEEVSPDRLHAIVTSLHLTGRLPQDERNKSPIAGVQPKIAVLYDEDKFYLPLAGSKAPTTHILKVSPKDEPLLTRHENALLSLAREIGLDVADCKYMQFDCSTGEVGALLSTRFDRVFDGKSVSRIHTEDVCQALGLARDLKYERDAEGAGHRFCAKAVGRLALQTYFPAGFQLKFIEQTIFNLAVGNTDNHAKNTSIVFHKAEGELAPLYDVVPVTIDDSVTHMLAFELGGASLTEDVTEKSLQGFLKDLGLHPSKLQKKWTGLLQKVAGTGIDFLDRHAGKSLADAVAAQISVLDKALNLGLDVPPRDYYPRKDRDEKTANARGGWRLS